MLGAIFVLSFKSIEIQHEIILVAKLQTEKQDMANAILKMSMFQLSLISQLLFFVNGADKVLPSFTSEASYNRDSNVTGINRIVGGSPTSIKEYPFMISIQWRVHSGHRCGGTYVRPRYILTAAHCVTRSSEFQWHADNPYLMMAVAGTASLRHTSTWQVQNIDLVMPHSAYDPLSMAHDIALLRTEKPFRITPYVNYVPLPKTFDSNLITKYDDDSKCTVLGWGKTSSSGSSSTSKLRYAKIPLIPSSQCSEYLGYHNLLVDHICAGFEEGGIDACQGDSGGPLICGGVQVGVVSWGLGCAAPNAPGVYNRVDVHLYWINHTIMRSDGSSTVSNHLTIITSLILVWKLGI